MRELTEREVEYVVGTTLSEAGIAFGGVTAIGLAAYGSSWGAVSVGLAFAVSPIAFVAMGALAFYAGYNLLTC
jgi:hypothetical protein